MPHTWQGHYLDGRSAARQPVTVQPMRGALLITTADGRTLTWPYAKIRQTQGAYEGEHIRLEYGGEISEALVVLAPEFLTALHRMAPELTSHVHDPARRAARVKLTVLAAIGALGLAIVLYLWGIPGLAGIVTPLVPVSWEQQLGRAVVAKLTEQQKPCQDAPRSQVLDDIVTRLTTAAPANPYHIRLLVVDSPVVNALAAPGGYIIVFRGLLEMTESPKQLAGVLAHELQHIYQRHTTRLIIEHASTGLLLAAVSGDVTGAMTYGVEATRALGMLQYSRRHEQEADAEGMRLLMAAKIDPVGMIEFFELLRKKSPELPGMWKYLSSHPATLDRIAYLKQLAGQAPATSVGSLPGSDWRHIRNLCQADRGAGTPSPSSAQEPRN